MHRPFVLLALVTGPFACGSDSTTGSGGSTSTGGSGGTVAAGGSATGGMQDPTSCADCGADEICVTCNLAAGPPSVSCLPRVVDSDDQFACGERVLCDNDTEVCVADEPPPGDNCGTSYTCNFFPSACDATPTCACITMFEPYQGAECTQLANGQFQIDTGF